MELGGDLSNPLSPLLTNPRGLSLNICAGPKDAETCSCFIARGLCIWFWLALLKKSQTNPPFAQQNKTKGRTELQNSPSHIQRKSQMAR